MTAMTPRLEAMLPGLFGYGVATADDGFLLRCRDEPRAYDFRIVDGDDLRTKTVWPGDMPYCMLELSDGRLVCSFVSSDVPSTRLYEKPAAGGGAGTGGAAVRVFRGSERIHVRALAEVPGGRVAGVGSPGAHVWDVASGECLAVLEGHTRLTKCVAVVPSLGQLVTVSMDCTMRWWDLATWECVGEVRTHLEVEAAQALPGERLVIGDSGVYMVLWDLAARVELRSWHTHERWVRSLALLGGDRLVSVTGAGFVRVWELSTFTCVALLRCSESIGCVTATRQGVLVVAPRQSSGFVYSFGWYRRAAAVRAWVVARCGE